MEESWKHNDLEANDGTSMVSTMGSTKKCASEEHRRRKPISVQRPFVVVGLSEEDIMHDFKLIQRATLEADIRRKNEGW